MALASARWMPSRERKDYDPAVTGITEMNSAFTLFCKRNLTTKNDTTYVTQIRRRSTKL